MATTEPMTKTVTSAPVLIAGRWRDARASGTFHSVNPCTLGDLDPAFPISTWDDCDEALDAAREAFVELRRRAPAEIAAFLRRFADRLDAARDRLVETAHLETGLPKSPRLADGELPRTTNQLRQAAAAAESGDWARATIDTAANIRSCYESLGPVCVFGPNNFPFAFNSVSGGDFAAAIAAGNPVIAKANSSHPWTSQLLAEEAAEAVRETGMPPATVQMLYRTSHDDGERLVSDPRVGATGYTGSRSAGLKLKAAADRAGKPIYLELSSVNPVVITAGALASQMDSIVDQYVASALMGSGQFCTNPGVVILPEGDATEAFIARLVERFGGNKPGPLLSPGVARSLTHAIGVLEEAGATLLCGGGQPEADRCAVANTLLRCSARQFLGDPETFQTEAFGNAALLVVSRDLDETVAVIESLEGNLTGCIYAAADGSEEQAYQRLAFALTPKVGRLLNDKMPTGVAVSPAMNHGGPYPATGHPGFTAVGIPASMPRFAKLTCYDNVAPQRLPMLLRDGNPTGKTWRVIDGRPTTDDVG